MVFAALLLLSAVGFAVTLSVSNSYKHREDALARRWFRLGQTDLDAGRTQAAVNDLRTALLYARDNPQYRLRLAQALAANNQSDQAVAYFLNLWEEQPGNGLYNVELARLAARQNRLTDANRYYQGAIYGQWGDDPALHRRRARMEFIQFLLQHNAQTQAQAEAISLLASTPPSDVDGKLQAAYTLMRTGDARRAQDEFAALIKSDPKNASLGAGQAAFELGHFQSARQYLTTALRNGASEDQVKDLLEQSHEVVAADPSQRHINSTERAQRVLNAYRQAGDRLQQCAATRGQTLETTTPTTNLQYLYRDWSRGQSNMKQELLAREPDVRDAMMDLVFRIEETAATVCGEPTGADWSLLMLSRYGDGVQR